MSAVLRLKMLVNTVSKSVDYEGKPQQETITLSAVYGKEGSANSQWSKYTPCGNLSMSISNPDAFDKVLPGQFMFVDLIPTDKDSI